MPKTARIFNALLAVAMAGISILASCAQTPPTGYRTYSLPDKGIAHLSFEYPASFNVRQVQLFDDTGYERMDIDGHYSRENRDRTTIWVVAQKYPTPVSIDDLIQNSMAVAAGLPGYRFIDITTTSVNGITARQFVYAYSTTRSDYETRILGFKPASMITRELFFTYNDLQWTIAMSADESTVDSDSIGFERLLESLTMLP